MMLSETLAAIRDDIRDEYASAAQDYPWIVGFSAGKDSTALLQLVLESVMELPPSERVRPIHILLNDTQVESPIYMKHVDSTLERIVTAIPALRLPLILHRATPPLDQTFWVNLIGRGYPSPNRQFRWCTDRMKIAPTNDYIRSVVSAKGQAILLLGVRRAESASRAQTINRYGTAGSRLNPHNTLQGCLVFRPIVDLSTNDLWTFLLQSPPPWGGSHRSLVTLYRNLNTAECPLVLDSSDAPSCGSNSYRFGCWTCTVVEKDRSMAAQIDAGNEWLEPLMAFRDYLADIRNKPEYRERERRNGSPGLGPFTISAREEILDNLLQTQSQVGYPLISEDEVRLIRSIWANDVLGKTERWFGVTPA